MKDPQANRPEMLMGPQTVRIGEGNGIDKRTVKGQQANHPEMLMGPQTVRTGQSGGIDKRIREVKASGLSEFDHPSYFGDDEHQMRNRRVR
jgi:hypothetical protein